MFESLEDAGLVTAAVNTYVCRGRVRHPITRPMARRVARRVGIVDAVYGPRRYFLGDLFFSDLTGAPRNFGGGIDRHGGAVGRWLVTRDGFDFLFFYLYETDAAQHRAGDVMGAVEGADRGLGLLVEAAGGLDRFLDRYAVVVVADHSQSAVRRSPTRRRRWRAARSSAPAGARDPDRCELAVTASNRVAMVYRLDRAPRAGRADRRARCSRLAAAELVDVRAATAGSWCAVAAASCASGAGRACATRAATSSPSTATPSC